MKTVKDTGTPALEDKEPEKATRNPADKETVTVTGLDTDPVHADSPEGQLATRGKAMGMNAETAKQFAKAVMDASGGIKEGVVTAEVNMDDYLPAQQFKGAEGQGIKIAEKGGGGRA